MNCRSLMTVACLVVSSFAARSAFGYVDESLDPSVGWVVTNETTRIAEERLTPEQEAAGVKPWLIAVGGTWNSCSIKTGSTPGDNTTLDLSKKFWRKSTKTVLNMGSGVAKEAFKGMTSIKKVIFSEDGYLKLNSDGSHFISCTSLEEVSPFLPTWLKSVGTSEFDGCTALKGDIVMPEGSLVGNYSFRNTKVRSLTIGSMGATNLVTINKQAFSGCASLTNVTILTTGGWKTVSSSGAGSNFEGCSALKNFTMMSFPTAMQSSAFTLQAAKSSYAKHKYEICFFVPKDIVDEKGLLTEGITPWDDLDDDVKAGFKARWADMGVKKALGVINDTQPSGSYHYGTYTLPAYQFVAYIPDPKLGMKLLFK